MNLPSDPDVVVVGGGLAGLAAAARVANAGKQVIVYEKRSDVGGQARSTVNDGFTLNQGPHALYRRGPGERTLAKLGVRIRGGRPAVKGRIVMGGEAHLAPAGTITLLRTSALSPRDKIEVASVLAILARFTASAHASQTVDEWINRSVKRERPSQMLHALVRLSTYVNQPDQLSAEVAIGQLQMALASGVYYLHDGWQSLVDQLLNRPNMHIVSGEGIEELPDARTVIVATGGPGAAARLLDRTFDVGPAAVASCIDFGVTTAPEHNFVLGGDTPFYCSNHSAVAKLAPESSHLVSAMQYLADGDEPDPDAISDFVRRAGVTPEDAVLTRRLHRMTAVTSMATASRGGLAGRPAVTDSGHDNVFIAGDWVGDVGHLADASLASGAAAGGAALEHLAGRKTWSAT